jgi:hypothetical protein
MDLPYIFQYFGVVVTLRKYFQIIKNINEAISSYDQYATTDC